MYFIYGQGGVGKTSLVRFYPAAHKLVITFDASHEVLAGADGVDVMVPSMDELAHMNELIYGWITEAIGMGYTFIVLDNVSNIAETVLDNLKLKYKDGRQAYGELQTWFRQLAQFMNNQPIDFLVTAWEEVKEEQIALETVTRYYPMMNQKARSMFTGLFDFVGRLHINSVGARVITTAPNEYTFSKNRLSQNSEFPVDQLFNQKQS
jgi:phage nucleotide-binding protein